MCMYVQMNHLAVHLKQKSTTLPLRKGENPKYFQKKSPSINNGVRIRWAINFSAQTQKPQDKEVTPFNF